MLCTSPAGVSGNTWDRRSRRVASEVSEYSKAPLPVLIDQ